MSIVVTVKDSAETLPGLLEDFLDLDWPAEKLETVLVDAFSTDGTWQQVQAFADRAPFDVVAVQKAGWIAVGRNEGFRHATGQFVAVTDADMRVPADWLRQLVAGMDDGIGVVGGPNDSARDDLVARTVGTIPVHGPSLDAVPVFGRRKYREDFTTDTDVYACVTRNSLFRRAAFEEVGGFDESLKVTEDPELNHRILQGGWRLRYRRAAGVRHVHRETLGAFFKQQRDYAFWQGRVNRTHAELASLKMVLPALGAFLFVLFLTLTLVDARALLVAAALAGGAVLVTLAYAFQAVVARRDPALLLTLPVFFVAWQFAWVVAYLPGLWSRGRRAP